MGSRLLSSVKPCSSIRSPSEGSKTFELLRNLLYVGGGVAKQGGVKGRGFGVKSLSGKQREPKMVEAMDYDRVIADMESNLDVEA